MGGSTTYDYRLSLGINKKNIGEKFASNLKKNSSLSTAPHSTKYYQTLDSQANKRYVKGSTKDLKKKRLLLKRKKSELHHIKECLEGSEIYKSDIGFLNNDLPTILEIEDNSSLPIIHRYFDLETGGFSKDADILQIAVGNTVCLSLA